MRNLPGSDEGGGVEIGSKLDGCVIRRKLPVVYGRSSHGILSREVRTLNEFFWTSTVSVWTTVLLTNVGSGHPKLPAY